jgi:hypothetical protein
MAQYRRRATKPTGDSPWWWYAALTVADLVLPIVAVVNWDPPWHGFVGALLLLVDGGIFALSAAEVRRGLRSEHL